MIFFFLKKLFLKEPATTLGEFEIFSYNFLSFLEKFKILSILLSFIFNGLKLLKFGKVL